MHSSRLDVILNHLKPASVSTGVRTSLSFNNTAAISSSTAQELFQQLISLSTHVLDTNAGKAGVGVAVELEIQTNDEFVKIATGATNPDGRVTKTEWKVVPSALEKLPASSGTNTFRITFKMEEYYKNKGLETLYPYAQIVFKIAKGATHYHIPLILSPYGYSTYRGT